MHVFAQDIQELNNEDYMLDGFMLMDFKRGNIFLLAPGERVEIEGSIYLFNPKIHSYKVQGVPVYSFSPLTDQEILSISKLFKEFNSRPYGILPNVLLIGNAHEHLQVGLTSLGEKKVYVEKGPRFEQILYHEMNHLYFEYLSSKTKMWVAKQYFDLLMVDNDEKEKDPVWNAIDESHVLDAVSDAEGHPYENAHEMFASLLTVLRYNPEKVKEMVSKLDLEQQAILKKLILFGETLIYKNQLLH